MIKNAYELLHIKSGNFFIKHFLSYYFTSIYIFIFGQPDMFIFSTIGDESLRIFALNLNKTKIMSNLSDPNRDRDRNLDIKILGIISKI